MNKPHLNKLHPGARWSFRMHTYILMFFLSFFLGWMLTIPVLFLTSLAGLNGFFILLFVPIIYIILAILIGEIYANMAYNRWFYEFNDQGLRIERGIIWKKYSNVPYERIQNVDIYRGVMDRVLGLSDLQIHTAGYGAAGGRKRGSEGRLPGLDRQDAETIREELVKRARGIKQQTNPPQANPPQTNTPQV